MKDEKRTKAELIRELNSLRRGIRRLEKNELKKREVEKELRVCDEKYRIVADYTADWEYWLDASGQIRYVSPSCETITGYPPDAFHRDPGLLLKITHPDDRTLVEEHAHTRKKRRSNASLDFRIIHHDGNVRWIGHRCGPVFDARGKWTGTRGSNRDITEEMEAQIELTRLKESFQKWFQNSRTCITIVDEKGRYLMVNEKSASGFGKTPDEVAGKTMFDFLDRKTAERYLDINRRLLRTGRHREYEDTFELVSGRRSFLIIDQCLMNESGSNYAVLSSAFDVTDRKQKENALKESEARYRSLFENSMMGISQALPDGRLVCVNSAYARMYGYANPEQMLAEVTDIGRQLYANPDDRREVLRMLREKGVMAPREFSAVRRDGSRFEALVGAREIRDSEGNLSCYQAEHIDITEQKKAEQSLRRRREELQAVYDNAPFMMCVLDENRKVVFANREFSNAVGRPLEGVVSEVACGVLGCVHALDDPGGCGYGPLCDGCALRIAILDTLETGRSHHDVEHCTTVIREGERRDVVWLGATARIPDERPLALLALQDITRQKQTEETLRKSEERYRAVVEDQTEVISRFKADGTVFFANDVYCRFFGKRIEDIMGRSWQPMAVPEDVPHIEAQLRRLTVSNPTVLIENRVFSGEGEVRWMQFANRGFFDAEGVLQQIQSVGRDITECKRAEAETAGYRTDLQELTQRLVHAQEVERKAISKELHDEIGQALTAVKINLNEMEKDIPMECKPHVRLRLTESDIIVEKMLEQVHEMSLDLHPAMLEDLGLVPTLRWYGRRFAKRVGIDVMIRAEDLPERLDPELELNLYRIIQEALTNIAKHAQAEKAWIRLTREEETFHLSVSDDGIGFKGKDPLGDRSMFSGMGLIGMQERIASLHGRIEIQSSPESGTGLLISVPWKGRGNA